MRRLLSILIPITICTISNAQNLVSNPGFETPDIPDSQYVGFVAGQSIGAWTVSFGDVHVVGKDWWNVPEGNQSIDLDGSLNGGVFQNIPTTPGSTYRLRFRAAGNLYNAPTIKPFSVFWNGALLGNFTYDGTGQTYNNPIWDSHEIIGLIATTSSTRLEFRSTASPQGFGAAIDAVEVVSASALPITGIITLQDYEAAAVQGTQAVIAIRNVGEFSNLETHNVVLNANGSYSFSTSLAPGTYDVVCEGAHWLRKLRGNVVLTSGGASGIDFTLVNGDADKDNEVNLVDYGRVSAAFGSVDGDPNWDANCDLNGDEEVNLIDIAIVNAEFAQAGDE